MWFSVTDIQFPIQCWEFSYTIAAYVIEIDPVLSCMVYKFADSTLRNNMIS